MNGQQHGLAAILRKAPVVPVLVLHEPKTAVALARALVAGGLTVLEITLRTPNAIDCLKAIAHDVEGAICGVGTVLTAEHLTDAEKAGARFAVSPGATPALIAAAKASAVPCLWGAATASESMSLLENGFTLQKFFPAEPAGGAAYLASLASPMPEVRFCPTGGIDAKKAPAYLALGNVIAVGGSWMAPKGLVEARDFASIEQLAREAAGLRKAT